MKCSCPYGPRCESRSCRGDPAATMGLKDRRTGIIHARADVSFMHPWSRGPTRRVMFLCDQCWKEIQEAQDTPLRGIDRPEHASEDWRPSLHDHVRLTAIDNIIRDSLPQSYEEAAVEHTLERMKRWSPQERQRYGLRSRP